MSVSFKINGKPYSVELKDHPVDITLNNFIREHAGLSGTKFMCLEGGCGACICVLKGPHPVTKQMKTYATNSCLTLLNACDGLEVITIEGVGNKRDGYHPIQQRLAQLNGTQCGYCSPAMVMNMYGLMESSGGNLTMEEIENSFGGNMCRCTGYRPILDAMKSFAKDSNIDISDIEDFPGTKQCPKSGKPCIGQCQSSKFFRMDYQNGSKWYAAKNFEDVFKAFNEIGDEKYMLVAGNTGHGVFRRTDVVKVFIDLNKIVDLYTSTISDSEIRFGANVNLTEAMAVFARAAKIKGFEYCDTLWKHFDVIANVPVRNMGTLGGNLMMKNANIDFPSDVFLTFETLNAKLIILEEPKKARTISVLEFVKTDMNKKILVGISLPSYSKEEFAFNSYKIMPRAQNAHAYVNASFLLQFNGGALKRNVKSARICFGGITAEFVHARATESYIIGKDLFDNNILKQALKTLKSELKPDWILPDASPEYRTLLACGLFYKSVLANTPSSKMHSINQSGASILKRELSSGTQTFETFEKNYPLTKPIPKLEALIQCSGEAFYMNDLPPQPNQVWCAFVTATNVNSRIVKIDESEALKIDGVIAFFSAKDIPGLNLFSSKKFFLLEEEEEIFCSSLVKHYNQPVGVIVATSTKLAERAAKAVKIFYQKQINSPILATIKDVFEHNASDRIIDIMSEVGKPTLDSKRFKASKRIESYLDIGSQYHYTMEPQTTVCVPVEDGMEVYCASQWIDLAQGVISQALNVKAPLIHLQVRRIGGGYGAKISRSCQGAAACALVCHKLNRPVRFVQTIESMMGSLGKRFACHSNYAVEFNDLGKIVSLKNTFYEDSGCTLNENPIQILSVVTAKNCYETSDKWKIEGKAVKTDAPSSTWCRGPGAIEGISMIENIMEHIAFETGRDSIEVRLENISKDNKMKTLLPEFAKSIDYAKRKAEIEKFNRENRWRKKGLGITVMKYPIEYFGQFPALVSVYHVDGTVSITHGGIEMGQGIHTKVAQAAAYTLKIPLEMIKMEASDTISSANSMVSGGGIASESVCFAVRKACQTLLDRLQPIRESLTNPKWEDIITAAYNQNISLSAMDHAKVGDMEEYDVWGLGCSEVEVDILTGNVQLNRVDILEDTGESLSPLVDIGQIEGAFVMGIGYWLTELLMFDRQTGELLTTRTWTYKPPGVKDIPVDFRINLLQKSPNPNGFLRSKATGEPSICLAVSVIFGIRHALDSARKDAGIEKKWYHLGAPTTPEIIMMNSGTSINMLQL